MPRCFSLPGVRTHARSKHDIRLYFCWQWASEFYTRRGQNLSNYHQSKLDVAVSNKFRNDVGFRLRDLRLNCTRNSESLNQTGYIDAATYS